MMHFFHRLLLLALLASTACAAPGMMPRSTLPLPEGFSASGGTTLPDRWWLAFDDPVLADLVERGLEHNPGLLATWARLDQADAAARGAGASRYPSVNASGGAGANVRQGGDPSLSISLGLSASYEVDLWGRDDRRRDARSPGQRDGSSRGGDHAVGADRDDVVPARDALCGT
jgi:outer membrane protein TolC